MIPHHCGDHSDCFEKMCGYTDLTKEHPEWSDEQVAEQYAINSRFNGKYMSLSNAGVKELQHIIRRKVDESNIDRVALLMSSNSIENLYALCAMHTNGKRLNLDQTDQWEIVLWTVICQISNEHFTEAVARRMGIESTEMSYNESIVSESCDASAGIVFGSRLRSRKQDAATKSDCEMFALERRVQKIAIELTR